MSAPTEPMVRVVEVRCQKCDAMWRPAISGGHPEFGFNDNAPPIYPITFLRQEFRHMAGGDDYVTTVAKWRDIYGCGGRVLFATEPVP